MAAWLAFFADKSPDAEIAEPVRKSVPAGVMAGNDQSVSRASLSPVQSEPEGILRIRSREPYVRRQETEDREPPIFGTGNWTPPPPKVVAPPPPPPQAPPIPYTYIGKKLEDGHWEVYLALGDDTRVVHAQSTLDGNYRVDAIAPPTMTVTYLPLKQVQTISIGTAE